MLTAQSRGQIGVALDGGDGGSSNSRAERENLLSQNQSYLSDGGSVPARLAIL